MRLFVLSAAALALAAAAVTGPAPAVRAESLRIETMQRDHAERLAEAADYTSEVCGADITAEIDFSTFEESDYDDTRSIWGYCEGPIAALRLICQDALGQKAVRDSLSRTVCARGAERTATLGEDGTYRYTFTWDDADALYWHRDNLENAL